MAEQDLPERINRKFLLSNREYDVGSPFHQWRALPWRQIIYLEVAAAWGVADGPYFMKEIWDLFDERRSRYETVYLLIDAKGMALEKKEFQQFLAESWGALLNRGDLFICPIEPDADKRAIWSSLDRIVGTRNTLRVFPDEDSAFAWALARLEEEARLASEGDNAMASTLPDKPTLLWLEDHADQRLFGASGKWEITAWTNVVYLKIRESWSPEDGEVYIDRLSGIPKVTGEQWERIFFIFDISDMAFKPEELHLYMRSKWLEVLDDEVIVVCLVEAKRMRRLLLHSMYTVLGKRSRVKILASPDEALEWVRTELVTAEPGDL
jgi:hypothetical protein